MSYKIEIRNPGNHISNPLLKLRGNEYATREKACEAIYAAMYDVITGESGCEMVESPEWNSFENDEAYTAAIDKYISDCERFIKTEGYADHDGVTASVEEIPVIKLHDINECATDHNPCLLALVEMNGKKYMAVQTRPHEAMPATWANPIVASIPMDWTMDRLLSSDGVYDPIWSIVAHGYGDDCEIVTDTAEINAVVQAIEDFRG